MQLRNLSLILAGLALFTGSVWANAAGAAGVGAQTGGLGASLQLYTLLPFIAVLLSIAVFPLVLPHFWHHHFGKITLLWSLVFGIPFLIAYKGEAFHLILDTYLLEYLPFLVLIGGLYTVSGGIVIRGTIKGKPLTNTVMLGIGTILASLLGTTGASMVLIRPMLKANKDRTRKVHVVVFFIFLVSNIGGSLTPLGDPPLFLGFLKGVPFFWTLKLFPEFLVASVVLLTVFFFLDSYLYKKENLPPDTEEKKPIGLDGVVNIPLLVGIMAAVLGCGLWKTDSHLTILGVHWALPEIVRSAVIVVLSLLSLKLTRTQERESNGFTWAPITEVAILFAGIFVTMIPALAILRAAEHGALAGVIKALNSEAAFFWITGLLSSFLDNAPTYMTFFTSALGKLGIHNSDVHLILSGVEANFSHLGVSPETAQIFIRDLKAISVGAVFMGANTYIGNAPNFMVKSIAEEGGVKMPSFFGYMAWSVGFLFPVFVLITLIFFRG